MNSVSIFNYSIQLAQIYEYIYTSCLPTYLKISSDK